MGGLVSIQGNEMAKVSNENQAVIGASSGNSNIGLLRLWELCFPP